MPLLEYSIKIHGKKDHVWETMLKPGKYEQWAKAFSENSQVKGKWEQGETVTFFDPSCGGTRAVLEIFDPHTCILAKHIAVVDEKGNEETDSEGAKKWIGTIEKYVLSESDNVTTLRIEMNTHESFVEMFDASLPKALENIKRLSEQTTE